MTPPDLRTAGKRWKQHRKNLGNSRGATVVGIVGSHTAEPIEIPLGATLLDLGVPDPKILFADFGQVYNALLDPMTSFGADLDHLLVLVRIEDLFTDDTRAVTRLNSDAATRIVDEVANLGQLISNVATTSKIEVTVAMPPVPVPPGIDSLDPKATIPLTQLQSACCAELRQAFTGISSIRVIDTDSIVRHLGHAEAYDRNKWAMYRQPYGRAMWAELGNSAALTISRRLTPPPKCIVVDCDNTLWGGIVGEDGLGGIDLGEEFPGRCFAEFQQTLLDARERGALLAICSKNEDQDVREVFEKHDAMQLKASDISAWRVNWDPKSENIRAIATELNIGLDSIVFIDDSHFEINEVSSSLPEVVCLQAPEEPALLPELLATSRLFAMVETSAEDLRRTEMIIAEGARKNSGKAMDRETFLASLELRVTLSLVQSEHLGRVAQLINKTNQFNLTTIRRTEAEVSALVDDDAWSVWGMNVEDKFGDSGLVGVAIIDRRNSDAKIDTLLMSCRVLGRGVETALLSTVVAHAIDLGASTVNGLYSPTQKNAQVADLYERHGFTLSHEGEFRRDSVDGLEVPTHIDVDIQ